MALCGLDGLEFQEGTLRSANAEMQIDGEDWNFTLTYNSIVQNKQLDWTVTFDRIPGKNIFVRVVFHEESGRTNMRITQSNFDSERECNANEQAWTQSLLKLGSILA